MSDPFIHSRQRKGYVYIYCAWSVQYFALSVWAANESKIIDNDSDVNGDARAWEKSVLTLLGALLSERR